MRMNGALEPTKRPWRLLFLPSPPFGMPSIFFEPYHTSSKATSGLRRLYFRLRTATVQQREFFSSRGFYGTKEGCWTAPLRQESERGQLLSACRILSTRQEGEETGSHSTACSCASRRGRLFPCFTPCSSKRIPWLDAQEMNVARNPGG